MALQQQPLLVAITPVVLAGCSYTMQSTAQASVTSRAEGEMLIEADGCNLYNTPAFWANSAVT